MADGLRQMNAELLIAKGIEQKVPDVVIPDESLSRAENVDFSKIGIAKKRLGFVKNSNLVLNAGVLDEMRRLGVRQRREVLCITETVTQIGSAAGVGNAGDTLFSYSEEAARWVTRGKMPRPNVDILWSSSTPGGSSRKNEFLVGGIGNYVCVAHTTDSNVNGLFRVVVFDVGGDVSGALREAPTVIVDTTFSFGLGTMAGWAQAGDKVWLFYGSDTGGTYARAFRLDTLAFDLVQTIVYAPPHDSANVRAFDVSSDGTNIYAVFGFVPGGYEVRKFDENLAQDAAIANVGLLIPNQEIALDARLGHVDIVRRDISTGSTYLSRYTKTTLSQDLANAPSTIGGTVGSFSNIAICTVNETDAVVVWGNAPNLPPGGTPCFLEITLVRMSTGAGLGAMFHMGLCPYSQPFIIDGRVFFIATHTSGLVTPTGDPLGITGTQPGEESFMCFQIPLDNMNTNNVPFPAAQWDFGQCVVKQSASGSAAQGTFWVNGKHVYQDGSGVYALTSGASVAGQTSLEWLPIPRLTRLEFGDATHRWRHEEFHDLAAFAGGAPFVYDGTRTYEMSTAFHQPVPLAFGTALGGSLADGKRVFMRAAMLYVDGNGRECWSQPSRIVSVVPTTAGSLLTAYITLMPVTTTMKPDMGNNFLGSMKLYLFACDEDSPNEFKVAAPPVEINPTQITTVTMFVTQLTQGNSQMYTSGFELDNFPAPPCRAMVVHSGRAFAIASDSNEVFYTKPFRSDRGPEFALGQSIPLPDKGTALASLNDRLVIFTHRGILSVGGDGPDVTGVPVDAFSRPVLVTQDYGCIEYCAAARTPLGVIFRGQQGFYLLDLGFTVSYVGGQVEDITSGWLSTRSIVHDQKSACCRITGFTGQRSEELCYWYDTKRWSLNVLASDVVDSVALGDNLLVAVTDTTVALGSRYRLGSRSESAVSQDFGESYTQVLETGWLSFQNAGVFKRVWRVYAQVRAFDSNATVRFQIWKDWEERVSSDREFELTSLDTEPRVLRVHLKHQKLKAVKVRVTVTSDGAGTDLLKLGFELGMRKSGPKEVREQTQ